MTENTSKHDLRGDVLVSPEGIMRKLPRELPKSQKTAERWEKFTRPNGTKVRCLLRGNQLRHVIMESERGQVDVSADQADINMIAGGLGFRPKIPGVKSRKRSSKGGHAKRLAAG